MGSGSSTAAKDKAAIASAEFTGPLSWSGLTSVNGAVTVVKTGKGTASLQDSAGKILLNVVQAKEALSFNEPDTGNTVVLVCMTQTGNFYTKKPSLWGLWTAAAVGDAVSENTPTGASMYRLGSLKLSPTSTTMEYLDAKDANVLNGKIKSGTRATVYGPDGKSPAAVVEGLSGDPRVLKGTCTFAKGVDPIVAFTMSKEAMGMAG